MKVKFLGFTASLIVASCFLTLVFFQIINTFSKSYHGLMDVLYVWVIMIFWTFCITAIPAALVVFIADRRRWRNFLPFTIVGAVLGSLTGFWFELFIMLECAAIGAVSGLTYWAIAGRFAGLRGKALA